MKKSVKQQIESKFGKGYLVLDATNLFINTYMCLNESLKGTEYELKSIGFQQCYDEENGDQPIPMNEYNRDIDKFIMLFQVKNTISKHEHEMVRFSYVYADMINDVPSYIFEVEFHSVCDVLEDGSVIENMVNASYELLGNMNK